MGGQAEGGGRRGRRNKISRAHRKREVSRGRTERWNIVNSRRRGSTGRQNKRAAQRRGSIVS